LFIASRGSVLIEVIHDKVDLLLCQYFVLSEWGHHGRGLAASGIPDLLAKRRTVRETLLHMRQGGPMFAIDIAACIAGNLMARKTISFVHVVSNLTPASILRESDTAATGWAKKDAPHAMRPLRAATMQRFVK
jgi:hypothetical protein